MDKTFKHKTNDSTSSKKSYGKDFMTFKFFTYKTKSKGKQN